MTFPGAVVLSAALACAACGADIGGPGSDPPSALECSIDRSMIFDGGVGRDGIPALKNPPLTGLSSPDAVSYLDPEDRVIGLTLGGEAVAIPHNILWWHEIVNLDRAGEQVAVTYCPLTGSSLVFDRTSVGGADFGVSGLLFQNNLMMFDRNTNESLWPQMVEAARCGPRDGDVLERVAAVEMRWDAWLRLHPATLVVRGNLGFDRDYTRYPYGPYESLGNRDFLFPMPFVDERRPPKERVLGVPDGEGGGIAFPFGALSSGGGRKVVVAGHLGEPMVVLWDSEAQGGMAFRPRAGGLDLSLIATDGGFMDVETGTRWSVQGSALTGALAGETLEPVAEAYVAFWGAWAVFHPRSRLWTGS